MRRNSCEGQDGRKSGESEGEATAAAGERKVLRVTKASRGRMKMFMATNEY